MTEHALFAKRVGLTAVSTSIVSFAPIVLLAVLTKTIGAEGYGVWIQIIVTVDVLPVLVTLGLPVAMMRFFASANDRHAIREGFYSVLLIVLLSSIGVSAAFFFTANILANALFDNNKAVAMLLPAVVFVMSFNYAFLGYFRALQQIKRFAFFNSLQPCCTIALVSTLVLSGFGVSGAVLGLFLAQLALCIIMAVRIIIDLGIKRPEFVNVRSYLSLGLPTLPGNLSYWIVNSSNRYIIGFFLGAAAVGYYSPGYTVGYCIVLAVTPVSLVLLPNLSAYFDDHRFEQVTTVLGYCLKYFLTLAIPAVFVLSLLSQQILSILSTPEIAARGYTVTPLIAVSACLFGVYAIVSNVLVLTKRTHVLGLVWVIAAFFNVVATLFLVPRIGFMGAAVATLFAFGFVSAVVFYYANRQIRIEISVFFVLKSLVASLAITFLILTLHPTSISYVVFVIVLGAAIYTALLWLLRGLTSEEISFFWRLLRHP